MPSNTVGSIVLALRDMFARFRIPLQLVSDNGHHFKSEQFKKFMALNGVKHIRTAQYHPVSRR